MKSSIKKILCLNAIVIASAIINHSNAQCNMMNMNHSSMNHNEMGSNAGEIVKTSNYQFEMVYQPALKTDPFTIYVMNKKGKPLVNAAITGIAEITYQDGSMETVSLFAKGENAYAVPLKNLSQPFVALFNIQIDKKNVDVRYEYKGADTSQNISPGSYYTCPMHPEIKSDKPGNCPKCGMTLEKKDNK
ncbi:MAG TPA: heavy metal-binding domain-containing protein [Bacteroidia bacterium]|nr:heavy metal-binding domain-containing protein [Bacteroidia bacterium]